ncbi:MAG: hypothetical protein B7Z08_00060 [Sphingomonadales bacterium 32-68-7]|nr:MAG: hypothetical protein B7Z33_08295 [Sphingomonadales bacterium 12-68-11]OYX10628.1 MAG: hypothetical protein B7Z08_00060 [Sphingomonadales bacterium 32-68-7]
MLVSLVAAALAGIAVPPLAAGQAATLALPPVQDDVTRQFAAAPAESPNWVVTGPSRSTDGTAAKAWAFPPFHDNRALSSVEPPEQSRKWVVIGPRRTAEGNELRRAADGLFYVTAIVNGAPVKFLVDTGASMIVLTAGDAERIGLMPEAEHFDGSAETANGRARTAQVTLDELAVGEIRSRRISAAVVRDGLGVSLLGQNWLSTLASLTIAGDRMVLR